MFEDSRGYLWVGTAYRGLLRIRLRDNDTTWYRNDPTDTTSIPSNFVAGLCEDEENRIWIGTGMGLSLFAPVSSSFQTYVIPSARSGDVLDPLAAQRVSNLGVYGIVSDRRGHLWLNCSRGGMVRFDIGRRMFQRFSLSDGIAIRGPRRGSIVRTPDGVIYSGGPGGVTWFHPDSVRPDIEAPQVAITQFRVFQQNKFISPVGAMPVTLEHFENTFSFAFATLDFRDPQENICRYMLEGVDQDWTYSDLRQEVTYAGIPPGEYRFRVSGANSRGTWSRDDASVAIFIRPPYWQTWWFRGTLALLTIGLLYGLYRYRLSKVLALERVRLRIADDLHDDIGSELSGIALESDLISRQVPAGSPAQDRLLNLGRTVRRAADDLREVVWFVNPELDRLPDLIARIRTVAVKMLAGRQFAFAGPENLSPISLDMEFRRHALMMFKEMLNNVVRHSGATNVKILLELKGNRLRMCVNDNGVGFDPQAKSDGRGLAALRARAEAIKGILTIDSAPGFGTSVCMEADIIRSDD